MPAFIARNRMQHRVSRGPTPPLRRPTEQLRPGARNLCLLVAVIALLAICSWLLWDGHKRIEMTARQSELNMAEVIASTISRDLDGLSRSISGAVEASEQPGIWELPSQLRQSSLFDNSLLGAQFSPVLIVAKSGARRAASSEGQTLPKVLTASDYFQFHQTDPSTKVHVTDYDASMFPGAPTIVLSKRINDTDGNFDGFVVGGLRASYYQDLFKKFGFDPQGIVSLISTNRHIIARAPADDRATNMGLDHTALFDHALSAPSGSFLLTSAVDNEQRLVAYRAVPGFPFVVAVARTTEDVFAEWRRQAVYISSALIVLTGLILMLMWEHWHELRRRRSAEICARRSAYVLSMTNRDLEKRIEQEVTSRKETMEKLTASQRLEALGQLAGGIAHDINNVLQTISGACQLLQKRSEGNDDIARLMSIAMVAADRGSAITGRLLVFARRAVIKPEPVDTRAVLQDLQELLNHTLGGVTVELDLDDNLPFMLADRMQFETVIINLATNARDAMPRGGTFKITARADAEMPEVGFPEGAICLRVSDTGTGMSEQVLAHALDPFFSTKGVGKGTGLGLPMAKGFADQSGGNFHIESTLGVGTTVTLQLPACKPTNSHQAAKRQTEVVSAANAPSIRILVVDDNEPTRELVGEALVMAGFEVQRAESGSAALSHINGGFMPNLLLTDLSMPGMDGIQLIRAVRRQFHELPAIILTGNTGAIASLAIEEVVGGRCSILHKPIRVTELSDHIHLMLNGSEKASSLLAA